MLFKSIPNMKISFRLLMAYICQPTALKFTRYIISRSFVKMSNFDTSQRTNKKLDADQDKDRPFTLPPGEFRPKQSLGQNFLSDQNYVNKIVHALQGNFESGGLRVLELGPGPGALSRVLYPLYPNMTAIEIDQRAVAFLKQKLPDLKVLHLDILDANWRQLSKERQGLLAIIGNLPFYITSQILFSLADAHEVVDTAVFTMQLEVAERVVAVPHTKSYGILSVVFQLYTSPKINFKIPSSVFFPKPKVESALVTLDFKKPHPNLKRVHPLHLRRVVVTAFQQRRKMMRQSLKVMLQSEGRSMPVKWETKRPEELAPSDFLQLTEDIFGVWSPQNVTADSMKSVDDTTTPVNIFSSNFTSDIIWRKPLSLQINASSQIKVDEEEMEEVEGTTMEELPVPNSRLAQMLLKRKLARIKKTKG